MEGRTFPSFIRHVHVRAGTTNSEGPTLVGTRGVRGFGGGNLGRAGKRAGAFNFRPDADSDVEMRSAVSPEFAVGRAALGEPPLRYEKCDE